MRLLVFRDFWTLLGMCQCKSCFLAVLSSSQDALPTLLQRQRPLESSLFFPLETESEFFCSKLVYVYEPFVLWVNVIKTHSARLPDQVFFFFFSSSLSLSPSLIPFLTASLSPGIWREEALAIANFVPKWHRTMSPSMSPHLLPFSLLLCKVCIKVRKVGFAGTVPSPGGQVWGLWAADGK